MVCFVSLHSPFSGSGRRRREWSIILIGLSLMGKSCVALNTLCVHYRIGSLVFVCEEPSLPKLLIRFTQYKLLAICVLVSTLSPRLRHETRSSWAS